MKLNEPRNILNSKTIQTPQGEKTIAVHVMGIHELEDPLDIMTVSSFYYDYTPTPRSLIRSLYDRNISVMELSTHPEIDLRKKAHVWLSEEIRNGDLPIRRIGCMELTDYSENRRGLSRGEQIIAVIQSYFRMLEIAAMNGVQMEKVGMPIVGSGHQRISLELSLIPILNECINFLKNTEQVKEIHIITNRQPNAYQFARALDDNYVLNDKPKAALKTAVNTTEEKRVFISYSTLDKNVADNLCAKLESRGIKVWYAPRNIHSGDYAAAIVDGISRATHFVVIISANSLKSQHVLNEINLAFNHLGKGIKVLLPLKLDEEELGPAFQYYLSRQHWMDANVPPLEKRLEEFTERILEE